jgi:uncharacterized membrane protein YfhO
LYNKFRAVSSIQVIAELCVPILAILGLKQFFSFEVSLDEKQKNLKKAIYLSGGLVVFGFLLAHMFSSFEGLRDSQYNQLQGLVDALIADRKSMLLIDSFRSLVLMLLSAGVLWMFLKNKLKQEVAVIAFIILVLFDLISVNKNYVNKDDFKSSRKIDKPFIASNADKRIRQDKTHFRVGNFTINPMNDGSTSYFHQSIGGYHAAKMMRYQELFEYQIAKNNMHVLNMLNTKYFIVGNDKGEKQAQLNPDANGNAWYVQDIKIVHSANEEMQALDSLNTKSEVVIDKSHLKRKFNFKVQQDSTATIELLNYNVTSLSYQSKTKKEQFAVFSEIFYKDGWNAYVDGKLTPHYRVNYVLRGMIVPVGEHIIEFKFEPKVIQQGKIISIFSYAMLFLIPIGWFFYQKKKKA